jgi:hypothetical protein
MNSILKDCLTENDGKTYCAARVAFFTSLFSVILLASYMTYKDPTALKLDVLANSLAVILASGGGSIALKSIKSA